MAVLVGTCRLKTLLAARKMSQREFARRMGVTVQQINYYVHNKRMMSVTTARKAMFILDCSFEELYSWEWRSSDDE